MDATARRGGNDQGPAASQPRFLAWLAPRTRQPRTPQEDQPRASRPRPPALPPPGVFISYRRSDTGPYALLLKDHLSRRFPQAQVFMDLDSIEAGLDFEEVIRDALSTCHVVIALIGPKWATAADEEGRRRIDDPGDYVRLEIRTALDRGVRVIPVLADAAKPLRRQQLPPDLRNLARLSALEISYDRYRYDETRLTTVIAKVLAATQPPPATIPKSDVRPASTISPHPPRCHSRRRSTWLPPAQPLSVASGGRSHAGKVTRQTDIRSTTRSTPSN